MMRTRTPMLARTTPALNNAVKQARASPKAKARVPPAKTDEEVVGNFLAELRVLTRKPRGHVDSPTDARDRDLFAAHLRNLSKAGRSKDLAERVIAKQMLAMLTMAKCLTEDRYT